MKTSDKDNLLRAAAGNDALRAKPFRKLTDKHLEVLDTYLAGYCRDKAGAWRSVYTNVKTDKDAYRSMCRLLNTKGAQAYLKEEVDKVLSRAGMQDLQVQIIKGLTEIFFSKEPHVRPIDRTKAASVLARICSWDTTKIMMSDLPQLEIIITDNSIEEEE